MIQNKQCPQCTQLALALIGERFLTFKVHIIISTCTTQTFLEIINAQQVQVTIRYFVTYIIITLLFQIGQLIFIFKEPTVIKQFSHMYNSTLILIFSMRPSLGQIMHQDIVYNTLDN